MNMQGTRTTLYKWIHAGSVAVRVKVEAVMPEATPTEPCLEPAALRFLDEVQRLANAGDVEALSKIGEVYMRRSA